MSERLTEYKTRKGVTKAVIKPYVEMSKEWQPLADKLAQLEDFMEKNGFIDLNDLQDCVDSMYDESNNAKQNQALKERWEKLKKWVSMTVNIPTQRVLDQMQELEKEDKDEE